VGDTSALLLDGTAGYLPTPPLVRSNPGSGGTPDLSCFTPPAPLLASPLWSGTRLLGSFNSLFSQEEGVESRGARGGQ